jgi:surfactin synthase thioesterase subunit
MLVNRLVNVARAGVVEMRLGDRFAAATQDLIRAQLVNGVAALQLVDGFDPASIVPLTIPITALHGDRDEQVSLDEMQAWGALTTSTFTCKSFPGNHVFVDPDQCEADVIQEVIRLLLPDQGKL